MPTEKTIQGPKRSPGERRRKAILDAAWTLFLKKGYAGVSVDEIIGISGGSKSSLYQFFGSKEGVLRVLTESFADEMLEGVDLPVSPDQAPEEALRKIGLHVGRMALSPYAISHARLAVSNARSYPEAAMLWFTSGPGKVMDGMARYLKKENAAGRLEVDDPVRAARYFLGMIAWKDHIAMSVGAEAPTDREIKRIVDGAVEMFMAAHGRK